MGYEFHITRAPTWTQSREFPITPEEWRTYLESDPDMRLDGAAEAELSDGIVLRTESPGLAVWRRWSRHGVRGEMAWFDHQDGEIVVKTARQ
jgi:hypothetical protein